MFIKRSTNRGPAGSPKEEMSQEGRTARGTGWASRSTGRCGPITTRMGKEFHVSDYARCTSDTVKCSRKGLVRTDTERGGTSEFRAGKEVRGRWEKSMEIVKMLTRNDKALGSAESKTLHRLFLIDS